MKSDTQAGRLCHSLTPDNGILQCMVKSQYNAHNSAAIAHNRTTFDPETKVGVREPEIL